MELLELGMSSKPPADTWGINFGGGLNSTAMIIECRKRGYRPDWILFADTGSELPETINHVEKVSEWCNGWVDLTVVRWNRVRGDVVGFEPLHENCLRTKTLPSKAYGLAGCTSKWKIQPMDRWRKAKGYDTGAFAVGYDSSEKRRITSACKRGDIPGFTAWYPLVAWGIDREMCKEICNTEGFYNVSKSSCFMCPNMKKSEWKDLQKSHPDLFEIAEKIESDAKENGHLGRGNRGLGLRISMDDDSVAENKSLDDRCHHAGCFT